MDSKHIVFLVKFIFLVALFILPFGSVLATFYLIRDKKFSKEIWFIIKKRLKNKKYIQIKNKITEWISSGKNSSKFLIKKIF